tara:strand:+ start:411 stop:593 length:183 start_codon:yes stop_codon:yes gene_type:complete
MLGLRQSHPRCTITLVKYISFEKEKKQKSCYSLEKIIHMQKEYVDMREMYVFELGFEEEV